MNSSLIKAARISNHKTQEQAAKVIGVSTVTYCTKEKTPLSFTLGNLKDLYDSFDDQGKAIVRNFLDAFFN